MSRRCDNCLYGHEVSKGIVMCWRDSADILAVRADEAERCVFFKAKSESGGRTVSSGESASLRREQ